MRATQLLHNLGQSIWLDNITRQLLDSGTLRRYVDELSLTGLISNPTICDHAIKNSCAYDVTIREGLGKGKSGEALFFDLGLEDLTESTKARFGRDSRLACLPHESQCVSREEFHGYNSARRDRGWCFLSS
jgi:hypothetical protein